MFNCGCFLHGGGSYPEVESFGSVRLHFNLVQNYKLNNTNLTKQVVINTISEKVRKHNNKPLMQTRSKERIKIIGKFTNWSLPVSILMSTKISLMEWKLNP